MLVRPCFELSSSYPYFCLLLLFRFLILPFVSTLSFTCVSYPVRDTSNIGSQFSAIYTRLSLVFFLWRIGLISQKRCYRLITKIIIIIIINFLPCCECQSHFEQHHHFMWIHAQWYMPVSRHNTCYSVLLFQPLDTCTNCRSRKLCPTCLISSPFPVGTGVVIIAPATCCPPDILMHWRRNIWEMCILCPAGAFEIIYPFTQYYNMT